MSVGSQAARRYAEAFIEASGSNLEGCVRELEGFASAVLESTDFRHVLLNPAFSAEEEQKVLGSVMDQLKLNETVRNFVKLVADRERMNEIGEIAETVRRLSDERAGRVRAVVETAHVLSDAQLTRLQAAVAKRTGRTVELEVSVDPSLIGGVRTTVGSTVYDGTLKSELERLRGTLAP